MVSRTVPRTVWPLAMNRPTSCQPMNPVAPATHFGESVCFSPDDMNADPSSSQRRHTPADRRLATVTIRPVVCFVDRSVSVAQERWLCLSRLRLW